MGNVIKKKKNPLLNKIIGKVKGVPIPSVQQNISSDVLLNDIRIDDDVVNAIALRRDELRTAKHDNSDVTSRSRPIYSSRSRKKLIRD
jgi:hypothetical protein